MPAHTGNENLPGDEPRTLRSPEPWIVACVFALSAFVFWHYLRAYPPHLQSMSPRALLGFDPQKAVALAGPLLFIGALNTAAWQLGGGLRRALGDTGPGPLAPLAQLAYGLFALPYLVLALATCHLLHPGALLVLLAVPCATLLPAVRSTGLPRLRHAAPSLGALARDAFRGPLPAAHRLTWLGLAVFLCAGPLLSALGPHVGWDADVYHLAIPERMLSDNGLWVTSFSMFTAFPAHMEMLYVLALGLSGDVAAKLVHFELGLLSCILVYRVAALESRRCALLALLFLASEPLLYSEMAVAYVDLVGLFYGLFAFASLRDWSRSDDRALLLRAGLFSGACVASRYLGGSVLLGLCAAWWLVPGRESLATRARATLVLAGLSILALLPWLVRNAVFTGNPIAPIAQPLFHAPGHEYFPPLAIEQTWAFHAAIGMGRDLEALVKLPWNLAVGSARGVYTDGFGYQLSPLHGIGFLSAVAVTVLRRRRDMARALVVIAVLVLLWFPLFQEPRFLLPAAGILALLAGWAFDELLPLRPSIGSALWVFPVAAVALAWFAQLDALGARYGLALATPPPIAGLRDERTEDAVEALRRAVEEQPDARVFLFGASRSYAFRGLEVVPYQALEAPPTLGWLRGIPDVPTLHCRLRAMDVSHLFVDLRTLSEGSRPRPVTGYGDAEYRADIQKIVDLMNQHARAIYDTSGIGIVVLEPAPACTPARPGAVHVLEGEPTGPA